MLWVAVVVAAIQPVQLFNPLDTTLILDAPGWFVSHNSVLVWCVPKTFYVVREIKLRLEEPTIAALDAQAAVHNVSRSEVIRKCISEAAPATKLDAQGYNQLVRDAYSFVGGGMDRRQFEGLVAFLFNKLATVKV